MSFYELLNSIDLSLEKNIKLMQKLKKLLKRSQLSKKIYLKLIRISQQYISYNHRNDVCFSVMNLELDFIQWRDEENQTPNSALGILSFDDGVMLI